MPLTNAGPSVRAGFIDAPLIGPPNSASKATVAPIAVAAIPSIALVSVATEVSTNMRIAVSIISNPNDCQGSPLGIVTPNQQDAPCWGADMTTARKLRRQKARHHHNHQQKGMESMAEQQTAVAEKIEKPFSKAQMKHFNKLQETIAHATKERDDFVQYLFDEHECDASLRWGIGPKGFVYDPGDSDAPPVDDVGESAAEVAG